MIRFNSSDQIIFGGKDVYDIGSTSNHWSSGGLYNVGASNRMGSIMIQDSDIAASGTGIGLWAASSEFVMQHYNGALGFETGTGSNPTRRMTISNAGEVGIGTAPESNITLTVKAKADASVIKVLGTNGNSAARFGSTNTDEGYLYDGGTIKVRIGSNLDTYFNGGNVGIGVTSPDRALHVAGSAPVLILESTESSNADLARGSEISWVGTDGARGSMAAIRGAHAGSGTDHKGMLRFYTQAGDGTGHLSGSSGTERMRIKANGIIDINSAGGAIDHGFVFYGNAKQFHVGQYDAQDELILGTGTTLGATGTKSLTIHAATSGYAVSLRATKTGLVDTGANTSISGSLTAAVNASISILRVHGTMIEAGSGTHPLLAGTHFVAPTITGAGAATTTGATVYISGAPATATNPYALLVDAGESRFDGDVSIAATKKLYLDAVTPRISSSWASY